MNGNIKWYNGDRGYGFIILDDNKGDVFFHFSGWRNGIPSGVELGGARVRFEIAEGRKGPEAQEIELIPETEPALPEP